METVKYIEKQNGIMNSIYNTCFISYQLVASLVLYEYSFTYLEYFEANHSGNVKCITQCMELDES